MTFLKSKWISIFTVLIIFSLLIYFSQSSNFFNSGPVMVASISSNGNYAVTTNAKADAILWDLQNKKKKIISHNANVYSAYFIKNTNDFIWQDLHNVVHVQNIQGKEILKFHNFPTYGEVMTSDLKHYYASDINWSIYSGYGKNQKIIKDDYDNKFFIGIEKLLNLTLSNDNHYLLSSGAVFNDTYDKMPLTAGIDAHTAGIIDSEKGNFSLLEGVTLWDVNSDRPLQKFPGNISRTFASLSPDTKYMVSGDESTHLLVWDLQKNELLKNMFNDVDGIVKEKKLPDGSIKFTNDTKGYLKPPPDMYDEDGDIKQKIFNIKFIDTAGHYLRIPVDAPAAILYTVNSPIPIKFFLLSKTPYPSVTDYSRDQSIDTSPTANILVMGQEYGNGIIVYKFDPKTLTLNKVWVGNA